MAERHTSGASPPFTPEAVPPEHADNGPGPEPLAPLAASETAGRRAPAHLPSLRPIDRLRTPSGVEAQAHDPERGRGVGVTPAQCGECLEALVHCFSQPLTALRGSLELALRGELNAVESRAALEQALELTDAVVRLMKQLRELADAAMAGAPPQPVSLRDLVKAIVEELRGLADSRGVKILLETSLPATVSAPPDRLREIIAKLLLLVIRRSPDHGEISLVVSPQATGSADFLLADQGPSPRAGEFDFSSSPECGLGRLFAEAAKRRSPEWAVVKVRAESLGGTLQVMPLQPQGCRFLFQLPLAEAGEASRMKSEPSPRSATEDPEARPD